MKTESYHSSKSSNMLIDQIFDTRTHGYTSTNIHFYPSKFSHKVHQNPILPNMILNYTSYHIIQFYDHHTVIHSTPNYFIGKQKFNDILKLLYDHMMVMKLYHLPRTRGRSAISHVHQASCF